MNANNPHGFQYTRRVGGGASPLEQGFTSPGVTLFRAQPIVREDGLIRGATENDPSILGVAAEGVTGMEGISQEITFLPALPELVFCGQVSSEATLKVIGKTAGISGQGGRMELNLESDNPVVRIIGVKDGSEFGKNTELYFTFTKSQFCGP